MCKCCLFKQTTANYMRIIEWSSGVCSSDQSRAAPEYALACDIPGAAPSARTTIGSILCVAARNETPSVWIWPPSENHDGTNTLAGVHQVEAFVDLLKREDVRDHRVNLNPAVHVPIDDLGDVGATLRAAKCGRSEEHTSELQSLMRNSYAVFCL